MKVLDQYILKSFLKTFFSVFLILMFIFILQAVWLYINELAGKDLEVSVILQFLAYVTPTLIPLILPLTILVSSIMVFGAFAENYEFAAMKSTGISLIRAMKVLTVFIIFLSMGAVYFANTVIPWANYNFYNLRRNIAKEKPAMAIAEGQFNQIHDLNIKVDEKSGSNGEELKNVTIHKKSNLKRGNYTVIKSKRGKLLSSEDSEILSLKLYDGYYYDEIQNSKSKKNYKPHIKTFFQTHSINVDLSELNKVDYNNKDVTNTSRMQNIIELNSSIDTLKMKFEKEKQIFSNQLHNRLGVKTIYRDLKFNKDSLTNGNTKLVGLLNTKQSKQTYDLAISNINSTISIISSKERVFSNLTKTINKHITEFHDKYLLGIACIVLFFIGAPLGAIIRKGGIGLPLVLSIVIFLTYHFVGIFAKNSSDNNTINPVLATWLATIILIPFSINLTYKAANDRQFAKIKVFSLILKFLLPKQKTEIKYSIDTNAKTELSKNDLENLKSALKRINNFVFDVNLIQNADEFFEIHNKNIQSIIILASSRNSQFLINLINELPTLHNYNIVNYIERKRGKSILASILSIFGIVYRLIQKLFIPKYRINTAKRLKQISTINEKLIKIIDDPIYEKLYKTLLS